MEAYALNVKLSGWGLLLLALTVTIGATGTDSERASFTDDGAARRSQSIAPPKRDAKSPGRRASYQDYQVPAGTWLAIELRTPVASDTSQRSDVIRGVLKTALTVDDVELVPSGAAVFGTVTDVAPALRKMDRARLSFRFNVLEHQLTGSRVAIRTETRALEVDAGKKNPAAEGAAAFNQVRLDRGSDVSVPLLQPFVVRIPDVDKAGK